MYTIYIDGVRRQVTLQELIEHEARLLEEMFARAETDPAK